MACSIRPVAQPGIVHNADKTAGMGDVGPFQKPVGQDRFGQRQGQLMCAASDKEGVEVAPRRPRTARVGAAQRMGETRLP